MEDYLWSRARKLSDRVRTEGSRKRKFTTSGQIKAVLMESWITAILLPTMPPVAIAISCYHGPSGPILTFALNFIAVIPLGRVLELVTRELIIRRGPHTGMVLIVTFRWVSWLEWLLSDFEKPRIHCVPELTMS